MAPTCQHRACGPWSENGHLHELIVQNTSMVEASATATKAHTQDPPESEAAQASPVARPRSAVATRTGSGSSGKPRSPRTRRVLGGCSGHGRQRRPTTGHTKQAYLVVGYHKTQRNGYTPIFVDRWTIIVSLEPINVFHNTPASYRFQWRPCLVEYLHGFSREVGTN
jgi:hypothetical protein